MSEFLHYAAWTVVYAYGAVAVSLYVSTVIMMLMDPEARGRRARYVCTFAVISAFWPLGMMFGREPRS